MLVLFLGGYNTFYGEPGVEVSTVHHLFVTRAVVENHPSSGAPVEVIVFRPSEEGEEPDILSGNASVLPHHVFTEAQVAEVIEQLPIAEDEEPITLANVSRNPHATTKVAGVLSAQAAEQTLRSPALLEASPPRGIDPEFWERVLQIRSRIIGPRQEAADKDFDDFGERVLA